MENLKIKVLVGMFMVLLPCRVVNAQVFEGFKAFRTLIEYEGQRYLMEDIYKITPTDFDLMTVERTIKEVDDDEGFMFVLTSYIMNGKSGVVITSFNATNFQKSEHLFTNVHLTHEEYETLYNIFISLNENSPKYNEHKLRKFNERLIADVHNSGIVYFTLWVDTQNRHTFTQSKWDKAYSRYLKFIEE